MVLMKVLNSEILSKIKVAHIHQAGLGHKSRYHDQSNRILLKNQWILHLLADLTQIYTHNK